MRVIDGWRQSSNSHRHDQRGRRDSTARHSNSDPAEIMSMAKGRYVKMCGIYATSWLQTSATAAFLLSLLVILACRVAVGEDAFRAWGWRMPFLTSVVLLVLSLYIRLKLEESPIFEQMRVEGRISPAPIRESFGDWGNLKRVLITLFGITTGMTVVWYTSQFYALFFMQGVLQVDYKTSYAIFAVGLTLGMPLMVLFGALSDRVGRKPIMVAGMLLGGLTLIPAFHALAEYSNPELSAFSEKTEINISADADCTFSLFAKPVSDCDKARNFFSRNGLSYGLATAHAGGGVLTTIGDTKLQGFDEASYKKALSSAGFRAASGNVNYAGAIMIVVWLSALTGMVYGPMAAFLVEMFPAQIRSTSLSLPYHIGVGILGGFLPFRSLRTCRLLRQHLCRPVVPRRDRARDGSRGYHLFARNQGSHNQLTNRTLLLDAANWEAYDLHARIKTALGRDAEGAADLSLSQAVKAKAEVDEAAKARALNEQQERIAYRLSHGTINLNGTFPVHMSDTRRFTVNTTLCLNGNTVKCNGGATITFSGNCDGKPADVRQTQLQGPQRRHIPAHRHLV